MMDFNDSTSHERKVNCTVPQKEMFRLVAEHVAKKANFDLNASIGVRALDERDDVFVEPEPEPVLSGFELEVELRGIISFCEDFLCGFEDDRDQQGVVETLERIRKLPPL